MTELEPFWKKHIELWERSGQTQSDYCARNGLSARTFKTWRGRLRKKHFKQAPNTDRFIEIGNSSCLEIQVGKAILRIPRDYEVAEVKRLLESLGC